MFVFPILQRHKTRSRLRVYIYESNYHIDNSMLKKNEPGNPKTLFTVRFRVSNASKDAIAISEIKYEFQYEGRNWSIGDGIIGEKRDHHAPDDASALHPLEIPAGGSELLNIRFTAPLAIRGAIKARLNLTDANGEHVVVSL